MFRLKSLLLCLCCGLLLGGGAQARVCTQSFDCGFTVAGGEEDAWPWVVVDLWENIEGVWVTEDLHPREFYRFEIKKRHSDGALAVKIDVLHADDGRVMDSYMSWGDLRHRDLRTVVKMYGKSHFLRVKAYDRSRVQCRSHCGGLADENIVLGMVMTPRYGDQKDRQLRLLRKVYDL